MSATPSRRITLLVFAAGALALLGCAAPPGPHFNGVPPPSAVQGQLIVYRPSVWFTAGVAVPVRTGGIREGTLPDASYLLIPLPPGWMIVEVNGLVQRVEILAGRNHYLELDLSRSTQGLAALTSHTLATSLTERGELRPVDEATALDRLQGLRLARPAR